MTQPTIAEPAKHKTRHASIRAKILLALLLLSLVPLVLFVALSLYSIRTAERHIRNELTRETQKDVFRLVKVQASVANAMLDRVEGETQTVVFYAQTLFRRPASFDASPSYSPKEMPADVEKASKYVLAPGVSVADARPTLDLTSNLDALFRLLKKDDPNLEFLYLGTESGVYRRYPWDNESFERPLFSLAADFALPKDDGALSEPLRREFANSNYDLSLTAVVKIVDPGALWSVIDAKTSQSFNIRKADNSFEVTLGYDPRTRPWYRAAAARKGSAWTKFPQSGPGKLVFTLDPDLRSQLRGKISPPLMQAFAKQQIPLVEGGPIHEIGPRVWSLQDKNENNYRIQDAGDKLEVLDQDILSRSQAVFDDAGRLMGVVGLAMNMDSLRKRLIHTPDEVQADAFLLNDQGQIVDQERPNMFIPEAGGPIRARMTAGETGQAIDEATGNYVFFAPILSVHAPGAKSYASVGMSVPETTITRVARATQEKLFSVLQLGVLLFFVIMPLPMIYAAIRTSRGIAQPILKLSDGVQRLESGDLDSRVHVKTDDEIGELADNFNKMAESLQTYVRDLERTTAEKERFESELRVAHDIQMSFLKKIFPPFPHRSELALFASIKPARQVGGDLYDFALLDDRRLFFYIGDVSDKGVPASLIMAITMTLMKRASLEPGTTPARILRQVNPTLAEGNENYMFVTLFCGILDFTTGELAFSNAGHNPPVILSASGEARYLKLPDGLVLGVMPESQYSDDSVILEHGDTIVIYTDGVTEAMNNEEELYSEGRLEETVAAMKGRSVEDTVEAIFASVKAHAAGAPQSDDIAVLAVRRT